MKVSSKTEETLFEAACRFEDERDRAEFLERNCNGDATIRARIEALLAARDGAEEFFNSSLSGLQPMLEEVALAISRTSGANPVSSAEEQAGARIDRYKILEKIGEGGCGIVYMAEQIEPVRRKVALKVIKLGMDTKSVIMRFEAERQALAMMDHPNIATVLDAGATRAGRPYFVMELVRGYRITDYCDEHQLGTRERLNLFIQVCQAIQHAHQKSVIHRDIKPSNILITLHDGVPVPKVIDFGIAKATEADLTEETLFTAYWQIMGTPAYMSPEQSEMSGLDVDTRSDIYSLGVLLYELLTGRTPFDQEELLRSGLDGLRRTLRETDPLRPSRKLDTLLQADLVATAKQRRSEPLRLVSLVRGDLDWIVMKALEKDRTRRYETANGFAMDIQRHLENKPVLARPPTKRYQFQKFIRRNRALFAAGSAVTLSLLAGLGVSSWLYLLERSARQRAVTAEHLQVVLRKEAEAGRAGEALLREQAEVREKITQAVVFIRDNNLPAADKLVENLNVTQPTLEGAQVYRNLAEWHAHGLRWQQATRRFSFLLQVNQLEWQDVPSLDYIRACAAWLELGDIRGYDGFRRAMIERFRNSTDGFSAERTIKCCLVLPADREMMDSLKNVAAVSVGSLQGKDENQLNLPEASSLVWRMVAISLMEYRLGRYENAEMWAQRCINFHEQLPRRTVLAKILRSMALQQLHRTVEASAELTESRAIVDEWYSEPGRNEDYYWFDWILAKIHLREAEELHSLPPTTAPKGSGR